MTLMDTGRNPFPRIRTYRKSFASFACSGSSSRHCLPRETRLSMCSAIQSWTLGIMCTPCSFYFGPVRSILPRTPQSGHLLSSMESFFIFAIETKKHPTRFAMPPVSSAGMTLWTGGHFYSSFTALAAHICEQVDVLLGGDAVNFHQELPAQSPLSCRAGSTTVRRFKVPLLQHALPLC